MTLRFDNAFIQNIPLNLPSRKSYPLLMKKILFLLLSLSCLASCDKTYICNCASVQGGLPYKKVYMNAKSENGAERKCTKLEEGSEDCVLQ
jgi:hypothetical protein